MSHEERSNEAVGCLVGILALIFIVVSGIFLIKAGHGGVWVWIIFVVIVGLFAFWMYLNNKSIKALPQMEAAVTVFSKTTESTSRGSITLYHVSFLFPDGIRRSLKVDVGTYNTLKENETGMLTYKHQLEKFKETRGEMIFIGFQLN